MSMNYKSIEINIPFSLFDVLSEYCKIENVNLNTAIICLLFKGIGGYYV